MLIDGPMIKVYSVLLDQVAMVLLLLRTHDDSAAKSFEQLCIGGVE